MENAQRQLDELVAGTALMRAECNALLGVCAKGGEMAAAVFM
jgi:hypothetical protein